MRYRFGGHTYLWADRWSDETLGLLERVKSLGMDVFEVALGDDTVFSPTALRREAERVGVELTVGPGGLWPMNCDIAADDPAHRVLGLRFHERMIDLAAASGASTYCGALYGHPGRVEKRRPPDDEMPRAADGLHALAEYGRSRGVALAIEPMSRFRTHLVNTPEQAVALVRCADHPNLSIVLDTYHLVTEVRDYGAAVQTVGDLLWGIHACESDRGVPGGGLIPWGDLFVALAEVRPDARILLETYNTGLGDFALSRGIFQDLCPDGDAFARQGIAFLKGCAGQDQTGTAPPYRAEPSP